MENSHNITKSHLFVKNQIVFTPRTLSALKRFVSLKQKTNSNLCEWHEEKLLVVTSPLKKCKFYFSVFLSFVYALYIAFQLIIQLGWHRGESKNFVDIFWTFLFGVYHWWMTGNNLNTILKQNDSITFIRGMIELDSFFGGII
jgi:hypothetical protein